MTVKQEALRLVRNLSEKCDWDEVLYQIYVCKQIRDGLKDEAEGRLISHAKVFARYAKKKSKP